MTWLRGITCTPPGHSGQRAQPGPTVLTSPGKETQASSPLPADRRRRQTDRERESKAGGLQGPGTMTTAQSCLSTADACGLLWPPNLAGQLASVGIMWT